MAHRALSLHSNNIGDAVATIALFWGELLRIFPSWRNGGLTLSQIVCLLTREFGVTRSDLRATQPDSIALVSLKRGFTP
jgi:hypothetical protein